METGFTLSSDRDNRTSSLIIDGIKDIIAGAKNTKVWFSLSYFDISQRYTRTTLGPLWSTLSLGLIIFFLGIIYSTIFTQSVDSYLPYFGIGLIIWTFFSTIVNEACTSFITAEAIIKQMRLPLSIHIFRMVSRNVILLLHNIVIIPIILTYFNIVPQFNPFGYLFFIISVLVASIGLGLFFATFAARFRDVTFMTGSAVQLIFFATPIIWKPESAGARSWVFEYNPIYYLIELFRAPILGYDIPNNAYMITSLFALLCITIGAVTFCKFRPKIAFWI